MIRIIMLLGMYLVASVSIASPLTNVWKMGQTPQPQQLKHDLVIVYGGADISNKSKIHPIKTIV